MNDFSEISHNTSQHSNPIIINFIETTHVSHNKATLKCSKASNHEKHKEYNLLKYYYFCIQQTKCLMQTFQSNIKQKPVFFDQDGSIDDLVSLITLLTLDEFRITGISVTEANCYGKYAVESTLRILDLFSAKNIQVSLSNAKAVNPFPTKWRERSSQINSLNALKNTKPDFSLYSEEEAADFTAKTIMNEEEKTIVIATGPATNLNNTIEKHPEILEKIEKIYWMAGAFLTDGNVIAPDHDGSAEWNIFWDPVSAQKLVASGVKIIFFPLDACYHVPVDNYLMYYLKKNSKKKLSKLAHQLFELTSNEHTRNYMWDVLPTMYLGFPDIGSLANTSVDIEIRGTSVGNIFKTSKGKPIHYANIIDEEIFYDHFIHQLTKF